MVMVELLHCLPNHFHFHSLTPVHPIDRAQQSVQNAADKLPPSSPDEVARLSSSNFVVVQHRLQILTESETFNCYLLWAASQSTERMSSRSLRPTLSSSHIQGSVKRWSPGCLNAAGKARPKREARAVTNFTKPGDRLLAEPC